MRHRKLKNRQNDGIAGQRNLTGSPGEAFYNLLGSELWEKENKRLNIYPLYDTSYRKIGSMVVAANQHSSFHNNTGEKIMLIPDTHIFFFFLESLYYLIGEEN